MSKSFTNLAEIQVYLQKKINETLLTDVSDAVKDEIESSISDTVFSAGTPLFYHRRSEGNGLGTGGLADKQQMETTLISDGVISTVDNASPSRPWDRRLDSAIEGGYGSMDEWFNEPRPFISNARENLQETQAHVSSLRDGLIKRGLQVI